MDYEVLMRFLLAALWGGIVGAEREYRSKSAGFRTMIMISMGSCFFTMMSALIGNGSNPDRIASNIVTGIGFLGAGVIFRGDNRVNGITTAATIWAVAAVGMGIGAGNYFAAACASILIIIVLTILPYLENVIDRLNQSKTYSIQFDLNQGMRKYYEDLFEKHHLTCKLTGQVKEDALLSITWEAQGPARGHEKFIEDLLLDDRVKRFEF
jgi:putative Mg2+ transporter-C (MgtC) family protein